MLSAYNAQHVSPISLLFSVTHIARQDFNFLLAALVFSNKDRQLLHNWDAAIFEIRPLYEEQRLHVIDPLHSMEIELNKSLQFLIPPAHPTYGQTTPSADSLNLFLGALKITKDPNINLSLNILNKRTLATRISQCLQAQQLLSDNTSQLCYRRQDGTIALIENNVTRESLSNCGFTSYRNLVASSHLYSMLLDYTDMIAPPLNYTPPEYSTDYTSDGNNSKRLRLHNLQSDIPNESANQTGSEENDDSSDSALDEIHTGDASQSKVNSSLNDNIDDSSISSSSNDSNDHQESVTFTLPHSNPSPPEESNTILAKVSPDSSPNSDRSPKRQRINNSDSDASNNSTQLHPRGMLTSSKNDPLYGIVFPNNNSQLNNTTIVTAGIRLPNSGIFPIFAVVIVHILSHPMVHDMRGTWNDEMAMRELIRLRGAVSMQAEVPYITMYRLDPQSIELTNFFSARLETNTLDTILLSEIPEQLVVMNVIEQRRDPHRSFLAYFIEVYLFKLLRKYYSPSRGPIRRVQEGHTIFQVIGAPLLPINSKDANYMFQMANRDLHPSSRVFNRRGEEVNALQIGNYDGYPQLTTTPSIWTRLSSLTSVNPHKREASRLTRTIEHLPNTMVAVLAHMRGPDINRAIIVILPTRNGSVDAQILPNMVYILEQGHHFITHDRSGFMFVTLTSYPTLVAENILLQDSQGFIICPPFIVDQDQPNNSPHDIYRSLLHNFRRNISTPFFSNLRNREHFLLPFNELDRQHLGPESWMLHVQRYINHLLTQGIYPLSRQLRHLRVTSDHRILTSIEVPRVTFNFSTLLNSVEILTCIVMATSSNPNDDDTSAENSIANNNIQAQYEIAASQSPQSSQESNVNEDEDS